MKTKKIVKVLRNVLALTLAIFIGFGSVAQAYSVSTSGTTTISPTNANFNSAKSPMYINKTQTINGSISSSYEMDIYHYECQEGGYYQIYTTGSTDTVGAIYEEQNSLFSSPTYKRRAFNDMGKITSADNFSMVIDMDKWEDYYVCVRGYSTRTGSYSLKIEPNQDKIFHKNFGVWECKYLPNSAAVAGIWTTRRIYITKEQAILYYWMLEPATVIEAGNDNYTIKALKSLYTANPSLAVNIAITALSSAVGIYSTGLGITTSVVGLFVSETLSNSTLTQDASKVMRDKLIEVCGVKHVPNSKTWSGQWSSKNGMLIKETFGGSVLSSYMYSYSKHYDTYTLTGEKWYYGTWSH